ncbi:unnamed protein product [Tilletia controversa]|uniref:tRNA (guanine(37)-N1)-methyltransferase n=3 Tax=Tilletia TaxID=13289 RepID=A0A8X7MZ35_9BASI|nr:hypothetical protein CF336_g1304 [Tilletia laevis]KAE8203656.1 hypothetical protein CF328_g1528 [Tilletia controversa]KAE8259527.1 hypothetical protein A4X03_0g4069 [Tilletia caries]KAE8207941.1 hypothetical protein CF335_g779 [Tilletia laevis]KAE8252936.1 hypothetical protein A4X06_0g1821 [Tilletia controversa]
MSAPKKARLPNVVQQIISPPSDIAHLAPVTDYVRPSLSGGAASDVARSIRINPLKPLFKRTLPQMGISLPAVASSKVMGAAVTNQYLFAAKNIRPVISHPNDLERRIVILNIQSEDELNEEARSFIASVGGELIPHQVQVDYDYYSADQILASLLPEGLADGTPTSFTIVGHIAHLNLRDNYLPYRFLIGEVILDKNARCVRTVVNKLDTIDAQFRFFDMELLAGVPEYETTASEQNCTYTFDFRAVYFNSRLHAEHARIAQLEFKASDVVIDVMAGVGPFAVPAAKKERGNRLNIEAAAHAVSGGPGAIGAKDRIPSAALLEADEAFGGPCWVLANDLNPASMASLAANVLTNKVEPRVFVPRRKDVRSQNAKGKERFTEADESLDGPDDEPLGLDGREFIRRGTRWAWDGVPWPAKAVQPPSGSSGKPASDRRASTPPKDKKPNSDSDIIGKVLLDHKPVAQPKNPPERRRRPPPPKEIRPPARIPQHFVMNLPASAIEFLDAYRGLFSRVFDGKGERAQVERAMSTPDRRGRTLKYPKVHVHCFTKALETPYEDIVARANSSLGFAAEGTDGLQVPKYRERPPTLSSLTPVAGAAGDGAGVVPPMSSIPSVTGDSVPPSAAEVERGREVSIHFVRRVSPNKDMYCLSFRLWAECVWDS